LLNIKFKYPNLISRESEHHGTYALYFIVLDLEHNSLTPNKRYWLNLLIQTY